MGEWKASAVGEAVDGDGDAKGKAKLLGVVYYDYKLGEVMELGQAGEFVAKQDGHLFLRCRDDFTQLADNKGVITVHFRRSQK